MATAESENDSSSFWELEETKESAGAEANPSDSFEAPCATSERENDARDSDAKGWNDEGSHADECGDAGREGEDWTNEDSQPVEWESDEDFFDRCHGVVTCTFTLAGEVVALPFRILGGVFRFIF